MGDNKDLLDLRVREISIHGYLDYDYKVINVSLNRLEIVVDGWFEGVEVQDGRISKLCLKARSNAILQAQGFVS